MDISLNQLCLDALSVDLSVADLLLLFSQVQPPECRVGGARGGLQQESSSPEQGHNQRTGERDREVIICKGIMVLKYG